MSNSYKDKRAHKARNPLKYFKKDLPIIFNGKPYERVNWMELLFREGIYPNKKPDISVKIQGKRRRCTSRKSNQKSKQIQQQIERAKIKHEFKNILKELENEKDINN